MLTSHKKSLFAAFIVVFAWPGLRSYAQSGGSSGTISGTVLDPSGAVVRMPASRFIPGQRL